MKILWIDLNSSYAHSSLALPALHAQIAKNNSVKWEIVSATINENVGMIVDEIYRHQPDIIAATTWLFNHEQLLHITARLKALLPNSCFILGGPEFLGNNEDFLHKKLNSSSKCNGIHINNLFKFFVWCEVSKSFTRSII